MDERGPASRSESLASLSGSGDPPSCIPALGAAPKLITPSSEVLDFSAAFRAIAYSRHVKSLSTAVSGASNLSMPVAALPGSQWLA